MKRAPFRPLPVLLLCLAALAAPAHADAARASRYYEDGLARFSAQDLPGAIIQLQNALQQDRDMLAAHLLLARAYLAGGDLGPAEVEFREALRLGVNRAEVAVPLARIYLLQGKPARVIDTIPAEGLAPEVRLDVLALRGSAYVALGKPAEAARSFADARAVDPASPVPLVAEVPLLLATGKLDVARERAERAVQLAPDDAGAWNARASVFHARGDLAGALRDYERALALRADFVDAGVARAGILVDLGRDEEARAMLDGMAALAPVEPRIAYLRALLASRRGDARAAAEHLQEVARLVDVLPAEWIAGQEQLLMAGALAHHAGRQYGNARKYLEVLVSRYPRNLGAKKLLAAVHLDGDDPLRAVDVLEGVLRLAPDDAQALHLLGRAWLAQKRYAKATELLERAAALGGDPRVEATLGFSKLGEGDTAAAAQRLQAAFDKAPGDLGLAMALANLHARQGNAAEALAVAGRAERALPGNPAALNLVGVIKAAAGDLPGARAAYREALQRAPGFAPARLNLARVDVAEGRFAEARQVYAELLKRDRRDATAMYESALLERAAGNAAEAMRWVEKAAAERPDDARIGLALIDARTAAGDTTGALEAARALAVRKQGDLTVLAALARAQMAVGDNKAAQQTLRDMVRFAEFDAVALVRIGYLQLAAAAPSAAAYSAQKALQGRPGDADALVLAAEAAIAERDYAQAAEHARSLRSTHPKRVDGFRLAGDLAMTAGRYAEAEEAYRAALGLRVSADLTLRRARALLAHGERAQALAALQDWLKPQPGDAAVRQALAELHMRGGDWREAAREYETLLGGGATGGGAWAYNNYALVLLELGDARALDMAARAHALAPMDAKVIDTYGWVLARHGRSEEGLRYLREARVRQPDDRDIRYHLAKVLHDAGRSAEARAELGGTLDAAVLEGPPLLNVGAR
ncbi:XrtA/PEP-CTERM system TPR-repeat protein PrsT [Pseudothauera rhizosphaerae]|uniref:PEP-CTERM system TPR-repeat protein PrsT n=1 Tax=Pseudothauera rhizosphaerae TaxID=2565932 RepID=A0A4S4AH83_9RHOO|nr:XrtA/PEP-CTERM system TPR-repeat protein PrsT [Pseudothauera rhizosphaerae]THF58122.1 PEP-CTERM system TPR-repeat protein PrsT [Pseudothauera rhizosphaerae]